MPDEQRKGQRGESGNYRREADRGIGSLMNFLAEHDDDFTRSKIWI